jgi:hypothetical protein
MSSKKYQDKFSQEWGTLFMRDWKVAGASISPKGMTTYSKCPRFVVNAVL